MFPMIIFTQFLPSTRITPPYHNNRCCQTVQHMARPFDFRFYSLVIFSVLPLTNYYAKESNEELI